MTTLIVPDDSWQTRALLATHDRWGKPSQMGLILRAVLHRQGGARPALGDRCLVTEHGEVICAAWDRNGDLLECHLGLMASLNDDFRRLADLLKFNDEDRIAMFVALKQWIGRDLRAKSETDE